jgi:hypothetical protein
MGITELKKLVSEYNVRAKTWNVTTLAVSALIKKLVIANFPFHDSVHADILDFTKDELESRFQRLFAELVDVKAKLIHQDDMRSKFEVELFAVRQLIDKSDEVDESTLVTYESGIEAANALDRLASLDVPFLVNYMRNHCMSFSKVSDLTEFLEKNFDKKLSLPLV